MTHATRPALLALVTLCAALAGCPDQPGGPFPQGGPFGGGAGGGGTTDTGEEQPGLQITDETGPDGCPIVELDPAAWSPLHASYEGGADPFFHLHTQEDVLFFGAELYTDYGAGWTGQTGTFAPSCGDNGICVYLIPDGETVTRATAGDVDVIALDQTGGQLDRPAEVVFRDMTFEGVDEPGVCWHVEEVTLAVR